MDESVYSNRIEKFLLKTLYHALRHYGRYILPNDDKSYIRDCRLMFSI